MKDLLNNKLVWLVIAVVAVATIALAVSNNNDINTKNSSSSSTSINTATQSKCMGQINDETFCKFAGAFANVGAYKVLATSDGSGGTQTIEMATDVSGNSSMVVKKNSQEQGNVVQYSGVTYVKDYSDGKWFKYPANSTDAPSTVDLKKEFVKGDFNKNADGAKVEYKKVGTEACGNLNCYKYQVIESGKSAQTGYLWFDDQQYLMRKVSVQSGDTNTTMDLTYENVTITEPSPTKDVQ